jgi:cysteine-rich repeat protein
MSKKLLFMLAAAGFLFPVAAQAQEVVTARKSMTIAGDMIVTGNAIGLSGYRSGSGTSAVTDNCVGKADSIGTFMSMDPNSRDLTPACTKGSAWGKNTTNDWTKNGSSAYLDLPEDAVVEYAELIWSGAYSDKVGTLSDDEIKSYVELRYHKDPNDYNPQDKRNIYPDPATAKKINESVDGKGGAAKVWYYINSQNVTNDIKNFRGGMYSVNHIPGKQDHTTSGILGGGWTLAVIYSRNNDKAQPTRNITLFVGGAWVPENFDKRYKVSGFCAPDSGSVDGRVFVSALEGDALYAGDYLNIISDGKTTGITNNSNHANNFFASQIYKNDGTIDKRGLFGDRNHNAQSNLQVEGARQGWDITALNLPQGTIKNRQKEATIQLKSEKDSFFTTMVGFQLDVNAPAFSDKYLTTESQPDLGSDFNVRLHMGNTGTAAAENVNVKFKVSPGIEISTYSIDGGSAVPTSAKALENTGIKLPRNIAEKTGTCDIVLTANIPPQNDPRNFSGYYDLSASWTYEYSSCNGGQTNTMTAYTDLLAIDYPVIGTLISENPLGGGKIEYTVTINNTSFDAAAKGLTLALNYDTAQATFVDGTLTVNGVPVSNAAQFFTQDGALVNGGLLEHLGSIVVKFTLQTTGAAEFDVKATSDPDGKGSMPGVTATIHTSVGNCGNGIRNSDEACDDGNNNDGDGCSAQCTVENGNACVQPAQGNAPCLSDPPNKDTGCNPVDNKPDVCGEDKDGDTIPDDYETIIGTDPNNPDSDGDGIIDGIEHNTGTNPTKPDSDNDGLCDGNKTVRDGNTTVCIDGEDKNVNGKVDPGETDPRDPDTDDGGVNDGPEVIRGTDPLDPSDDLGDVDSDCDTIPDEIENKIGTNPNSADTDGDGLCDGNTVVTTCNNNRVDNPCSGTEGQFGTDPNKADTDGDGISDGIEAVTGQNRTDPVNPDTDGDGLCDGSRTVTGDNGQIICIGGEDMNNDGKFDKPGPNVAVNEAESDPTKWDTDGGGASDGEEYKCMTDRNNPADDSACKNGGSQDSDNDTIPDDVENKNGTDPNKADTDGDGLCDGMVVVGNCIGAEGKFGTDPLKDDTDDDGLKDGTEAIRANDPNANTTDPLDADSDGDGLCDGNKSVHRPATQYAVAADCEAGEDMNNDGIRQSTETNPGHADTDLGGVNDGQEVLFDKTNPLNPADDVKNGNQGNQSESADHSNDYIEDDCACQSVLSSSHSRFPALATLMALLGAAFLGLRRRKDSHKA